MSSLKERLWTTLQDLGEEEFKRLKWFLQQADIMHTIVPHVQVDPAIPVSRLEKADRQDTVVQMVQAYGLYEALQVTQKVLMKINRNDLAEQLFHVTSAPKADEADSGSENRDGSSSESREFHFSTTDKQTEGLMVTSYQRILQSNLQNHFMCIQEGLSEMEDKTNLDDIYTELYVTDGGDMQINRQHEIRRVETMSRRFAAVEKSIRPCDIFKHPSGKYQPIRTVLTNGIAGIGKTFLVHKFILDWAEGRTNQDVHLIFPFSFREMNLLKGRRFCLSKLIGKCIKETRDITEEALNHIFTTLQSSGNTNYDKSQFKLLFVLDGLDENRLPLDFTAKDDNPVDLTKPTAVEELLVALIKGSLLPSARLWITTRPAAATQIPLRVVDIISEVRGFTDPQKEVYFTKRLGEDERGRRIISHIKASRSLYIMCHIPVFCWITATVLEDVWRSSEQGELPKTLTQMYSEYLAFQMRRTREKYGTKRSIQYIESLAKLAFHQLKKGNLIFYESDLSESGINFKQASVYSGVFTQIFKKERWRNRDRDKGRMFSFVHLSIQEFLAAVHVQLSLLNHNKNVMAEAQPAHRNLLMIFSRASVTEVHRVAVDKALESPDGHLDLFLRFLLGLSLPTNQSLLTDLLRAKAPSSDTNQETVQYIKSKIRENPSPERSINLFHCLNELNDHSLVEEIQHYLSSGSITRRYLSPAQWSALVFFLQSSEKQHEVLDLKKYCASEVGLLRLLPLFETSVKFLLSGCNLSEKGFRALASVLPSQTSNMRELDLSSNNPGDAAVKLLCAGLDSRHCRLQVLRLAGCNLSEKSCEPLASVLGSQACDLRELDLSNNSLGNDGLRLLSVGLLREHCRLERLRLNLCALSGMSCDALADVLSSPGLKHLEMSNNDLCDSGAELLSAGLKGPRCRLETLRLSGCLLTDDGCASLASALSSGPSHLRELDLSYNHPGETGISLLSAGLKDPNWHLETLRVEDAGKCRMKSGLKKYACALTLDPNTAHRQIILGDNNRKAVRGAEEQPYARHPDRFEDWFQLLGSEGLTGRCYWEVQWDGRIRVAVTYRGISRRGEIGDCSFGWNEKSWSLECNNDGYCAWHNKTITSLSSHPVDSDRVAVYLDWSAGTVSFYRRSSGTLLHLHTFYSRFTEPLYPGFWVGFNCSMALSGMEEDGEWAPV